MKPGNEEELINYMQCLLEEHITETNKLMDTLITTQETNTKAINELTESTGDLIKAWEDGKAVIRVGGLLARFLKWAASISVVGVAITWLIGKGTSGH